MVLGIDTSHKVCTLCAETKSVEEFAVAKDKRSGRSSRCKVCVKQYTARWYAENAQREHEKRREYMARRRAAEPAFAEAERERLRQTRAADPERWRAKTRVHFWANKDRYYANRIEWAKANPERVRDISRRSFSKRRARVKGGHVDAQDWRNIVSAFNSRCAYCLVLVEAPQIEHMIPLAGGGTHTPDNVVPACAACNGRKGTKSIFAMVA